MKAKKGILLINLGTPDSPSVPDVRKYLNEFLMDGRVMDIPLVQRTLLVKGVIVPFRSPNSAKLYQSIWDPETGSPLLQISKLQHGLLQEALGDEYQVELAMRYQEPSIEDALDRLRRAMVDSLLVFPLFPQYASASTGSVFEKVMGILSKWHTFPKLSFVNQFYDDDLMIETFADNARKLQPEKYDHILFSFHGLPVRQLHEVDLSGKHGCDAPTCCEQLTPKNKFCYSAQSYETARRIAEELGVGRSAYTVCFQSRLGKTPWVQPYTSDVLKEMAAKGHKRLLVFCPAFVADCLETVHEVRVEYAEDFRALGGEEVQLVPSLNDHPKWIASMKRMVLSYEERPVAVS